MRLYSYVGPAEIGQRIDLRFAGTPIRSLQDLRDWSEAASQEVRSGIVVATFVVNASGILLIADRRSEHVAAASGGPVLAAGELTFAVDGKSIEVVEASNQSTGYCPEPASWSALDRTLSELGLPHPASYTLVCDFRRCMHCRQLTLIKDQMYVCELCGADLPAKYNIQ